MRVTLLLVALLGLLPEALPAVAPGNDWDFAPPDSHPAALLEPRKPQPKEPHGVASEKAHDCDGPRCGVSLECRATSADTQACLTRYSAPLRPDSTGPPA